MQDGVQLALSPPRLPPDVQTAQARLASCGCSAVCEGEIPFGSRDLHRQPLKGTGYLFREDMQAARGLVGIRE